MSTSTHKVVYDRFSHLPFIVRSFCFNHDGWIVGGGARYLLGLDNKEPRDWDILIPLENWNQACKNFPKGSLTNSFGGVKVFGDGVEVDVWGDSLGNFILTNDFYPSAAVNLKNFTFLVFDKGAKYDTIVKEKLD
jgi:hypothetical protein